MILSLVDLLNILQILVLNQIFEYVIHPHLAFLNRIFVSVIVLFSDKNKFRRIKRMRKLTDKFIHILSATFL